MINLNLPDLKELPQYDLTKTITKGNPKRTYQGISDEIPDTPGVYFILDKASQLLYVGQTQKIRERMVIHSSRTTWFDSEAQFISYILENKTEYSRHHLEDIYIAVYHPPKNNSIETPWHFFTKEAKP